MKLLSSGFLALCLTFNVSASVLNFGTAVPGTTEGNNYNGINVVTTPAQAWAQPIGTSLWESIQPDSLNPPILNGTVVKFNFDFTLAGTPTGGTLGVLVDDSAEVALNGITLANNLGAPQAVHCAATKPNCTTPLTLDISSFLTPGLNTLDVWVEQDGANQFGVDVYGTASSVTAAPEPAAVFFAAMGLIGISYFSRKRS